MFLIANIKRHANVVDFFPSSEDNHNTTIKLKYNRPWWSPGLPNRTFTSGDGLDWNEQIIIQCDDVPLKYVTAVTNKRDRTFLRQQYIKSTSIIAQYRDDRTSVG